MERVMYPNSDHGLTPGYVFTRPAPGEEKRYPGLVAVHGGYHFSLDESSSGSSSGGGEGYVVILPEYRGAAATGPNTTRRRTTGART